MKCRNSALCFDVCQMNRYEFELKSGSRPSDWKQNILPVNKNFGKVATSCIFFCLGKFLEQLYLCWGILSLVATDRCAYVWPLC